MIKNLKKLILLTILISSLSNAWAYTYSYRSKAVSLGQKSYEISLLGSIFQSTGQFDPVGEEVELNEGQEFTITQGNLDLKYAFRERISFTLGGEYRQLSASTNTTDRSATGLSAISGSILYYFIPQGKHSSAVEFKYINKPFSNTIYTNASQIPVDEIVLGDDENIFSFLGHYSFRRTGSHHVNAKVGYNLITEELSDEIIYDISTVWAFSNWAFHIGVDGKYSMAQSEYSDDPAQRPLEANGQTLMFNSINQDYNKAYGAIAYGSDSWRAILKMKQTLQGVHIDKGTEYSLNVIWNSNAKYDEAIKISNFKEYSIEGTVIKVSPRGKFVKIDQGLSSDISKGMKFDLYKTDFFGGNILTASGIAYEVGADWSIIRLTKRYKNIAIKKGFLARGQ